MDGRALGGVFQHIVFERSLVTMIREGYLSDIRCISVGTNSNLDNVGIRNGDFAKIIQKFKEESQEGKAVAP
jgi:superfamily II DNA or RNA helicase